MANVTTKQCDRCKRLQEPGESFARVTVERTVDGADDDERDGQPFPGRDLCPPCDAGLDAYMGGAKLARKRKASDESGGES